MRRILTRNALFGNPHFKRGQTFVEFILLFIAIITISFLVMRSFNIELANRWERMIEIIASPDIKNKINVQIR